MKNEYMKEVYTKPKWYWFLPIIGFISYMVNLNNNKSKFTKDKEYQALKTIESKFLKRINILVVLLFIINICVTNIGWFIWKGFVKKAGWIL